MDRTRIKLTVEIDLDPVYGAMHTAEDAETYVQIFLENTFSSYNPKVTLVK